MRAALLLLIAEAPRNGYQLMRTAAERSGGRWRPSTGSVYPTLAQLEDEGLIRAEERDGARVFELTAAGRRHVDSHPHACAPWDAECEPDVELAEELHALVGQLHLAAMEVGRAGDVRQMKRAAELISATRRQLYRILAEDLDD